MPNTKELKNKYDAIVVGSGGAGLTAALQAHELGLNVVVLEKNEKTGGNTSRASSGMNASESLVQLDEGIIDNNRDFYEETLKGGGLLNDRAMLKYFVNHSALAISWLMKYGIRLTDLTITGGMSKKRAHRPASMEPVGFYLTSRMTTQVKKRVLTSLLVLKLPSCCKMLRSALMVLKLRHQMALKQLKLRWFF